MTRSIASIFNGPAGVRAGWRFLAFVAIVFALGWVLGMLADRAISWLHVPSRWLDSLAPAQMLIGEILFAIPTAVATYVMARLERRPILSYGFTPSPRSAARFLEGVLAGSAAPAAVALLMLAFGGMTIRGFGLHGTQWLVYPAGWLVVMLMVGFVEEATFRGYPLFALRRGLGFWPAAAVMTLLFGAAHLGKQGENAADIGSVIFLGLFACFTLWMTGSLWFAAGFHFAFDFMQFFVIGTRNGSQTPQGTLFDARFPGPAWINGGPLGTEASYFVFPVTLALFAYVAWRYAGRRNVLQTANETISPASR